MKILFTGTIYVGKSTLLRLLENQQPEGCSFVCEVAQELLNQNQGLEMRPEFQDILFAEQVRREGAAISRTNVDVIICDRGVPDILAYSTLLGHGIKQEWIDWSRTYDKIFFFNKEDVPFTPQLIAEKYGDLPRDWVGYRNTIDNQIRQVLSNLDLQYEPIAGTEEERLRVVKQEIEVIRSTIEGKIPRKEID